MANDGTTDSRSALSAGSGAILKLTRSKSGPRPCAVDSYQSNGGGGGGGGRANETVKIGVRSRSSSSIFRRFRKTDSCKRATGDIAVEVDVKAHGSREQVTKTIQNVSSKQQIIASTTQPIGQMTVSDETVSESPTILRQHHSGPQQQQQQHSSTLRHLAQDVIVLATNGILVTTPAAIFPSTDCHSLSSISPSGSPYSDRHCVLGFRISPKTSPRPIKRGFYGSPTLNSPKLRRESAKNSPKTVKAGLSKTLSSQGKAVS
ncbi:hypothetical protein PoB_001723500 [Plakobranchus ocellatus]|uniref:Uncharacterized protein n=1 Tax=Plakobranchus ocellatus TaxID=259542 RepID=A0AAV3Z829_9GAST|nr:hypothetical protein PoB_001723500 [Plakobranchus ocellatus]